MGNICSVVGCAYAGQLRRGMCKKHYRRVRAHGSVAPANTRGMSLEERLRFHGWTETPNGCWEWNGSVRRDGYGRVSYGGKGLVVTRVAYEVWIGPIPEGYVVRHKCDNPPCVNPEHLEVGTVQDNVTDMLERGRFAPPRGEVNGQAKLTEDNVRAIRASDNTYSILAQRYNVSIACIAKVVNHVSWSHV